jgi:hypothetical protein
VAKSRELGVSGLESAADVTKYRVNGGMAADSRGYTLIKTNARLRFLNLVFRENWDIIVRMTISMRIPICIICLAAAVLGQKPSTPTGVATVHRHAVAPENLYHHIIAVVP